MGYPKNVLSEDVADGGSGTINATTAGTSILIPSTASGSIYITSLLLSNGATASTISIGYGSAAVAPTTTSILIQPIYLAINSNAPYYPKQPIQVPSSNNVLTTGVGGTTQSVVATFYVAP